MKLHPILLTACTLLLLTIPFAQGSDYRSGERVTVDKPVTGDLYVGTGELWVKAPIAGDLIAAGGEIKVMDSVMQDILVSGGELYLEGYVGDDVRAAGGRITVSGTIAGDLLVFGGEITIEENANIMGDLRIFGGDITINGTVDGDFKTAGGSIYFGGEAKSDFEIKGGDIEINGNILGPATLAASEITLGENARFNSPVRYWQEDGEMDFGEANAHFDPELEEYEGDRKPFGLSWTPFLILYGLSILVILIILNFLFNKPLAQAADTLQKEPAQSLAYGAVYMLGLPILGILLLVTIIGIPIGLLFLALGFFSWIFSLSIAAVITAKSLKTRYNYQSWNTWLLILVSAAAFAVLKLISLIPFIGWLAYILVVAMALGSIILRIVQQRKTTAQQTAS